MRKVVLFSFILFFVFFCCTASAIIIQFQQSNLPAAAYNGTTDTMIVGGALQTTITVQ